MKAKEESKSLELPAMTLKSLKEQLPSVQSSAIQRSPGGKARYQLFAGEQRVVVNEIDNKTQTAGSGREVCRKSTERRAARDRNGCQPTGRPREMISILHSPSDAMLEMLRAVGYGEIVLEGST